MDRPLEPSHELAHFQVEAAQPRTFERGEHLALGDLVRPLGDQADEGGVLGDRLEDPFYFLIYTPL